MKTKLTGFFAA